MKKKETPVTWETLIQRFKSLGCQVEESAEWVKVFDPKYKDSSTLFIRNRTDIVEAKALLAKLKEFQ